MLVNSSARTPRCANGVLFAHRNCTTHRQLHKKKAATATTIALSGIVLFQLAAPDDILLGSEVGSEVDAKHVSVYCGFVRGVGYEHGLVVEALSLPDSVAGLEDSSGEDPVVWEFDGAVPVAMTGWDTVEVLLSSSVRVVFGAVISALAAGTL